MKRLTQLSLLSVILLSIFSPGCSKEPEPIHLSSEEIARIPTPSPKPVTNNGLQSSDGSGPRRAHIPTNPDAPDETETTETYDSDMKGQLSRIMAEGQDESNVRGNILAADTKITYEHLKKNADKYAGKPWSFTGKILEIQESDGVTIARISQDNWGNKAIYVVAPVSTEFLEDNRVFVVGYLAGSYTYESQAGWTITIPAMAARAIIKPNEVAKLKSAPAQ